MATRVGKMDVVVSFTEEPLRWRHIADEQPKSGEIVLGAITFFENLTVANVTFIGTPERFEFFLGDFRVDCEYWAAPILLPDELRDTIDEEGD